MAEADLEADDRQTEFGSILSAIASQPAQVPSHRARVNTLMQHFAKKQIPLSVVADEKHLKLSMGTLKRYARELQLVFPDYVPQRFIRDWQKPRAGDDPNPPPP